ncbi:ParB/RepB/Spo0J family partition protein [Aquidulcibacter paucihalophilus]|uniref:ParB/RepB/Spo0J family partition protein n=1 Tax=Aquidulcibacter paucihalophilus TaxID=1978549 RepID=UPI000A195253|nr:ParB/RepB/Spo0J family partition protein [Aquidulcibacter paucihalophilus]
MSHVQMLPLKALQPSPLNARRIDKKIAIDELAASIEAHGLLQGLSVVDVGSGKYQVSAGGRRLAALKLLLKRKAITSDFEVPCQIVPADLAEEASLAENVQRVAMHPLDEVEAFGRLAGEGQTEDAIAARFGATVRHVRQRLALAALSPTLKEALRKGELGLDAARAFCLIADHERQDAVFAIMTKPVSNAYAVRSYLTQGAVRVTDRLAKFVGVEAYEEAGGIVRRDLFDDSLVFLDSPDLLNELATAKLEEMRAPLLAQGWGWVSFNLGNGRADGGSMHRIRPEWHQPTEEQKAAAHVIRERANQIEQALASDPSDEALIAELKSLRVKAHAMAEALSFFDPEKKALAGCVISIDFEGHPDTILGIVAKGDQKKIARIDARRDAEKAKAEAERSREKERLEAEAIPAPEPVAFTPSPDGVTVLAIDPAAGTARIAGQSTGETDPSTEAVSSSARNSEEIIATSLEERPPWEEDEPAPINASAFTQKTLNELTSARTRAIRAHLCEAPDVALALSVYTLGCHFMALTGPVGMSIHAFVCHSYSDAEALASKRDTLKALDLYEENWFDWCLAQGPEILLQTQALLIASTLDLSHSGNTPICRRKQEVADTLATRLQVDMTKWWAPTSDFFMGLNKAQITVAIMESPAVLELPTAKDREAFEATLASKRKDELAHLAAQTLDGTGWLPSVIRTDGLIDVADPDEVSAFEITEEGLAALANVEAVEPDLQSVGIAAE